MPPIADEARSIPTRVWPTITITIVELRPVQVATLTWVLPEGPVL
jgi:hypothetical protein